MSEQTDFELYTREARAALGLIKDVEKLAEDQGISKDEALHVIILARRLELNPSSVDTYADWPIAD